MLILAIDTTTRGGSVALARQDELVSLVRGDETRTHGERLPGEIARALESAAISKSAIDLIAVAAGPGAFTGLRIGLATAQGLALTLDRPVVGVSALDALAWTVLYDNAEGWWSQSVTSSVYVAPWMDAQRGDVFAALYRLSRSDNAAPLPPERSSQPWAVIEPPLTARPDEVLESWRAKLGDAHVLFIGDAATRDAALITRIGNERWHVQSPDALAPAIASLGRRVALEGRAGKPHAITPIYVRRPDAEIERERRRRS